MSANRTARSIRLPDELWVALEIEAREQKRSVNNLVEVILTMCTEADAPEPLTDEITRLLKGSPQRTPSRTPSA